MAVVLILTVATGNVVVAGHNTVLDPDFVLDTMEDEGAYEGFEDGFTGMVVGGAVESDADGEPEFMTRVLDRAVTTSYIQSQVDPNVYRTYEYLHGNRDDLELRIETAPLVENIEPAIQKEIRAEPTGTLIVEFGDTEGTTEVPAGTDTIDRLERGPKEFEAARTEFRKAVREEVLEEMIEEAKTERTSDELLALTDDDYDPDAHTEAEKERMVEEREDEIDAAIREKILDEEDAQLRSTVDETLDELVAERDAPTNPSDIQDAGAVLEATVVAGLADREMTYETYESELTTSKTTVGEHLANNVADEIDDEVGEELVVTDELDKSTTQDLEDARTVIGILDIAGVVLPLLALAFVGLLWVISRSIETVTIVTGASLSIVGIPGFVIAMVAESRILAVLPDSTDPADEPMIDLVSGLVTRTLSTFQYQSLVLAVIGVALLGIGLAVRNGYVDLSEMRVSNADD
ncbi:MAG: hypothetical protein ACOCQ7_00785 [Natronomonas sp.]